MTKTLDFIVIGAQKAGTTSLFEYLRRHPELRFPPGKEFPYFSHQDIYSRGWEDYMAKAFAFADPSARWGTVTPQYLVGGLWEHRNPGPSGQVYDERTVPLRIRERIPDARLIAILRDPVERARSHYRMAAMNGIDKRSFGEAIHDLITPDALAQARREPRETTGYIAWGEYGRLLGGYFDVFPASQILVVFTDDLDNKPETVLRCVAEFVNVRANFVPDNIGVRYRTGGARRRVSWLGTYSRLSPWAIQRKVAHNPGAKRLWHAFPAQRRRQVDRAFARLNYKMDLWNRRSASEDAPAEPEIRTLLRTHYGDDGRRLAALIERLPPWTLD